MTKPNSKKSAIVHERGAISAAVVRAIDELPGKTPLQHNLCVEKYEDKAWELYYFRRDYKPASELQLKAELQKIRKTAKRLGKLIKDISSPGEVILEAQFCSMIPKRLNLGHSICEVSNIFEAVSAAETALEKNTADSLRNKKGPIPEPLIDEIADMAATDYWLLTSRWPSLTNEYQGSLTGHVTVGDFVHFLEKILVAMGINRSVETLARAAAERFKVRIPEGFSHKQILQKSAAEGQKVRLAELEE